MTGQGYGGARAGPKPCRGWRGSGGALDRDDRAVGLEDHPLRAAAEEELADRGAPPQTDHDQLGTDLGGGAEDLLRRGLREGRLSHLVVDAERGEALVERVPVRGVR